MEECWQWYAACCPTFQHKYASSKYTIATFAPNTLTRCERLGILHLPKVFAQIHSLQNNDYFFLPRINVRKAGMFSISSRCTSRKWICMQGILGYKVSNDRCLSILIWYFLKIVFEFQVWKKNFLRKDHGIKNNWIFHWHIMSSSVLDTLLTFYCKPSRTLLQYHFRAEVIKLNSYFSFSIVLFYNHSVVVIL